MSDRLTNTDCKRVEYFDIRSRESVVARTQIKYRQKVSMSVTECLPELVRKVCGWNGLGALEWGNI